MQKASLLRGDHRSCRGARGASQASGPHRSAVASGGESEAALAPAGRRTDSAVRSGGASTVVQPFLTALSAAHPRHHAERMIDATPIVLVEGDGG